jgi:hypothetical protein
MPLVSWISLRRLVFLSLSLFLLIATGCTTEPVEPERQPEKAVILPVFTLHKELRRDASIVQSQLVRALREAGYDCAELGAEDFEKLQRTAFDESGSIYNPTVGEYVALDDSKYRASLLQQLRTRSFDMVILPELKLRSATVQDKAILWDGVSRSLQVEGNAQYLAPRQARGLSLLVMAYGSTGVLIGRGIGGITVPFYLDATTSNVQFKLRDSFYDIDEVSEGVEIAIKGLRRK